MKRYRMVSSEIIRTELETTVNPYRIDVWTDNTVQVQCTTILYMTRNGINFGMGEDMVINISVNPQFDSLN